VWQVTPSPFHAFHVLFPPLFTVVDDVCKRAVVVVVVVECKRAVVVVVVECKRAVVVVVVVDVADKKPVLVVADALPLHADVQVDFELQ
jgi:hypothetical protein